MASIKLNEPEPVHYQDRITFTCVWSPLRLKNPRVAVNAYDPASGDLLYGEAGGAADSFQLGGGMSEWVMRGGGPAHCIAQLYWFVGKNGKEWTGHGVQADAPVLAMCEFDAT